MFRVVAAFTRSHWCCCCAALAVLLAGHVLAERSLFTRERNDGLYTTFTSLAGKMFDELVINAIVA